MATHKQIVQCAREFDVAQEALKALKDRKQVLQDELNLVQASINEAQITVTAELDKLKVLVNE